MFPRVRGSLTNKHLGCWAALYFILYICNPWFPHFFEKSLEGFGSAPTRGEPVSAKGWGLIFCWSNGWASRGLSSLVDRRGGDLRRSPNCLLGSRPKCEAGGCLLQPWTEGGPVWCAQIPSWGTWWLGTLLATQFGGHRHPDRRALVVWGGQGHLCWHGRHYPGLGDVWVSQAGLTWQQGTDVWNFEDERSWWGHSWGCFDTFGPCMPSCHPVPC